MSHASTRFCDPHQQRLGKFVLAEFVVAGENFCRSCFSGNSISQRQIEAAVALAVSPKWIGFRCPIHGRRDCRLSREQLLSLLGRAKAASERDWLLFLVSFWHSLRVSEALNLRPENFVDGRLSLPSASVQPLIGSENSLLDERIALERRLAQNGSGERLFPISRIQFFRLMRRYGREAELPGHLCHPHVLRHSRECFEVLVGG